MTDFNRGELVNVRKNGYWLTGIVTDVFTAPVTGQEVVVVGGDGYYVEDVSRIGWTIPEPQSLRA